MEEIDRDHSRKIITYFIVEDPDEERASKFVSKAANNEIRLQNLQEDIRRLDTLHHEGNSRMLNALDAVGKLNKEMKELKELRQVKMTLIKKLNSPTQRPKSFTPSSIVGDVVDGDWDQIQNKLKPCSLCGKCFPIFDVVMGSYGCLYHPWCILTQTWISRSCANEKCKKEFTSSWMRSMELANIEGKLINLCCIGLSFKA